MNESETKSTLSSKNSIYIWREREREREIKHKNVYFMATR